MRSEGHAATRRHARLACSLVPPSSLAVVDPVRDPRWLSLIESASDACIFHHPAWLALLARTYRYPLIACAVLDAQGELEAGVPLALVGGRVNRERLVALPFSDTTPPLARNGRPSQWRRLGLALDQLHRLNGIDIELRGGLAGDSGRRQPLATYHRHVLSLADGYDEVVRAMKPQVGRGQRRARREGLQVEFRGDARALAEFYGLHVRTRRRQGVPTQPKRFIMGFEELFRDGLGFVVLIRDGGLPVAAAVFLAYGGTLVYKFGASNPGSWGKRPNHLLFMEAIRWACASGIDRVDFGRTDEGHEGLRAFKASFGAAESLLVYSVVSDVERAPRSRRGGGAAAAVIRRTPPLVGRLAGEVLYREFAA